MQPITRETILDRRQPSVRWSAVLAGAAVAVGLWGVLELLGIGAGLTAINPDDARSFHGAAKGAGVWSFIAPIIAMFVGGYLAGRHAQNWDRRVLGTHGLITWGLTSVVGLLTSLWMMSEAHHGMGRTHQTTAAGAPDGAAMMNDAQEAIAPVNTRLRAEGKSVLTPEQLMGAVRNAATDNGVDRDKLISELDDNTALSKAEAADVVRELGDRPTSLAASARRPSPEEREALQDAEDTGKALLGLSIAMLFGLAASVGGALLSHRRDDRRDRGQGHKQPVVDHPSVIESSTPTYPATTIIE